MICTVAKCLILLAQQFAHPQVLHLIQKFLGVDGTLSWSTLFGSFWCRSVYTRSGKVTRPLTPVELSRAYDLPPWVGQAFAFFRPQVLPWLMSPPIKLLCHVGWFILQGGSPLMLPLFSHHCQ